MERLTLEFPSLERKDDALDFLQEFKKEGVHPCGTNKLHTILSEGGVFRNYEEWFLNCQRDKDGVGITGLPTETYFLVRESDNRIIGMNTIRFLLDDRYWNDGGNIGYSIRKSERRKGYNKINLYLALERCRERRIETVLIDCAMRNLGSSRTIRAFDGKILRHYLSHLYGEINQTYVIDVFEAVRKYCDEYADKIIW